MRHYAKQSSQMSCCTNWVSKERIRLWIRFLVEEKLMPLYSGKESLQLNLQVWRTYILINRPWHKSNLLVVNYLVSNSSYSVTLGKIMQLQFMHFVKMISSVHDVVLQHPACRKALFLNWGIRCSFFWAKFQGQKSQFVSSD